VVEPNWASHPTASGTITFSPFNFNVIEGTVGAPIADGELYDVSAAGGQIKIAGPYSELKHVLVSRTDWNSAGFVLEDSLQLADYDGIYVEKPPQAMPAIRVSASLAFVTFTLTFQFGCW
jgi:hypothetical protein